MIPKEFAYSEQAHYAHWSAFKVKTVNIVDQNIVVTSDGKNFQVSFPDVSEKYILPYVESDAVVQRWRTGWIRFWQNRLNFAVWCATTGCGVDFNNHLKDTGMIGSLFRFHVYYQTRRILFEMAVALPQDTSWNAFDNNYNRSAYERICKEFTLTLMLIGGKNRVTIKALEEYTTTGQILDTAPLIKESNTTKRIIHLHKPQPMI